MSQRRPGMIVNFLIRALVGMVFIFFVNEFLSYQGVDISVGLNPITFLTSGTLGLPGVAFLYGVLVYQIL